MRWHLVEAPLENVLVVYLIHYICLPTLLEARTKTHKSNAGSVYQSTQNIIEPWHIDIGDSSLVLLANNKLFVPLAVLLFVPSHLVARYARLENGARRKIGELG